MLSWLDEKQESKMNSDDLFAPDNDDTRKRFITRSY